MFVKRFVYSLCVLTVMVVIFGFSNQQSEETRKSSDILVRPIENTLKQNFYSESEKAGSWKKVKHIIVKVVRKSAHMFLFFLLAVLVFMCVDSFGVNRSLNILCSFIFSVMYACTDEFHQLFVSGRTGRLSDVVIDMTGVCIGLILISIINGQGKNSLRYITILISC